MDNIIQMLIPLIVIILTFVLGNSRRRRERRNTQTERAENAMPEGEGENAPPPFMEDFPFETQLEDMILQQQNQSLRQITRIVHHFGPCHPLRVTGNDQHGIAGIKVL